MTDTSYSRSQSGYVDPNALAAAIRWVEQECGYGKARIGVCNSPSWNVAVLEVSTNDGLFNIVVNDLGQVERFPDGLDFMGAQEFALNMGRRVA